MGLFSKPSQPTAPDPAETAAAESRYNRIDTFSPSGSGVRHGYTDPTTGEFRQGVIPSNAQAAQTTVESDTERQIRELLEPASVDLVGRVITDNVDGLPDAARVQDRGSVADSIFNRSFSLMAPAIDRANSRLLTNLQSRGLPIGSEAFNEAYGNQQRETQDTIQRLALDADVAAGQEQSRQFQLDAAERSGAISEIIAAMGGGYNPATAVPTGSAAPINYSGMVSNAYNADVNRFNNQVQSNTATAGTLGTLGSALIKSSMEYKNVESELSATWASDIVEAMPLYVWRYLPCHAPAGDNGTPHIGPMAEHFQRMTGLGDGKTISPVDYFGLLTGALQHALHRIEILEAVLSGETVH